MSRRLRPDARVLISVSLCAGLALLVLDRLPLAAQLAPTTPDPLLERVSSYVQAYYARAQSLMVEETVTVQPLQRDWTPDGFARQLLYELRLEWFPGTPTEAARATVVRELVRVNNRPPTLDKDKEDKCMDPRLASADLLAFLLPEHREGLSFKAAGRTTLDGRQVLMLDYRATAAEPAKVTGDKECYTIEMPGRSRGRLWMDAESYAVLRLEEGLLGPTDAAVPRALQREAKMPLTVTVNRADTYVTYRPVTFTEPDEVVLLPSRVDIVNEVRQEGTRRVRIAYEYRNYRRFLTESRIVANPEP